MSDPALAKRLDQLEKLIPAELPEEDRQRFITAQQSAEPLAQAFGDSAGAPRWLNGETVPEYRRRLIDPYKKHSRAWRDVDLNGLPDQALDEVEKQIRADALQAATHPANMPVGMLREIQSRDQTGRTITRFVGSDDAAAWTPFTFGERKGRINTRF